MLTDFHTLSPTDSLVRAVELTLAGSQKDFPVLVGQKIVGVLRQADLLTGLARRGAGAPVGEFMQPSHPPVELSERIESVFTRLQNPAQSVLSVVREVSPGSSRDGPACVIHSPPGTEGLVDEVALDRSPLARS